MVDKEQCMDEQTTTERPLSEEDLQQITGGTSEDATTWFHNLSQEHRDLINAYKGGKGFVSESDQALAKKLAVEYSRLAKLSGKPLTIGAIESGSTASRVGQLRPKRTGESLGTEPPFKMPRLS
jgi:bacteriocin-like protein